MSSKITNFIPGSCFGYYDEKFQDCLECKIKDSCKNCTQSQQSNQVKKIFKITNSIINDLVEKYKK